MRVALALIVLAGPAFAAGQLGFVGTWDCGVTTMTFTESTYDGGSGPMPMRTIEGDGTEFEIGFDDGYKISVALNDDGTMQWLSHASGDAFTCTRED